MSAERFIADRISDPKQNKGNISGPIVKIGIIGIATGICVMLMTVSIVSGFKKEIIRKITGLTSHVSISSVNMNASNEPEPITISNDTLKLLRNITSISHIQPVGFKNGLLRTESENEGVLLKGVDSTFDFSFLASHMRVGKLPSLKEAEASKEMLISESLSDRLGLKVGQRVQVYFISQHAVFDSTSGTTVEVAEQRSRRFTISGIYKTDFADFDRQLCFVDLRHIQRLNYWDASTVGSFEVILKDFSADEHTVSTLEDLFGYTYSVRSAREIYSNIFSWLEKLDVNGVIIVVLMVLVATVNMITALLILILERANMVGLLKSFGMNNRSLRRIFLNLSFRLTLKGLVWGNLIGIALCLLQYRFGLVGLDSATYYVDHVAVDINWWYYLVLNAGTVLVCMAMLLFPTMLLGRLSPLKTLKLD